MRKWTSNTARLACLALPGARIVLHGNPEGPLRSEDLAPRQAGAKRLYLYPSAGAPELTAQWAAQWKGPLQLIVPDGAWGQTRKFFRRLPGMENVSSVRLPEGVRQRFALRRQHLQEGLSSGEAIALALGALEGPAVQSALEDFLYGILSEMMQRRGKIARLPSHQALHGAV